jgi:hypothetical protein
MISTLGHVASSKIKDAFIPLGKYTADGTTGYPLVFSGIPQNYKDLMLVIVSRSTIAGAIGGPYIRLNDDGSALYQSIFFEYNSASTGPAGASASRSGSNVTLGNIGRHPGGGSTANTFGTQIVHINNYSSTAHFKTVLTEYSSSIGASGSSGGYATTIYKSTNAITSIRYSDENGGNIASGSTFRLYGIRNTN